MHLHHKTNIASRNLVVDSQVVMRRNRILNLMLILSKTHGTTFNLVVETMVLYIGNFTRDVLLQVKMHIFLNKMQLSLAPLMLNESVVNTSIMKCVY